MVAYQHIESAFAYHFKRLRRLEPQKTRPMYNLEQFILQRTIGQYCYLAEEMLDGEALDHLKCALRLDEAEWRAFKQQGIWGLDIIVLEKIQQSGGDDDGLC